MNLKAILIVFRLALKSDTQEAILRVRNDNDFSERRYDRAVNMFMTEFPNGDIMQGKRRLAGYKPHKKKRTRKKSPKLVPLTDSDTDDTDYDSSSERHVIEDEEEEMESSINLSDISSDDVEWTSGSSSD
jgi:hypothetical protein